MMTKVFMNVLAGYVTILTSQQSLQQAGLFAGWQQQISSPCPDLRLPASAAAVRRFASFVWLLTGQKGLAEADLSQCWHLLLLL